MYNLSVNNLIDFDSDKEFDSDYLVDINYKICEVYKNNKIQINFDDVFVGPSVIRLEYKIGVETNLNKVKRLASNVSLATGIHNVSILAPVPGKSVIGIELPRKDRATVGMKDIINGEEYNVSNYKLPVCIGKDIVGNDIIEDLASFPHLLLAGSTGSGKSICVNSIIVSLLYRFSPEELNLVMIDPKMVELSAYKGIKHLLFDVADNTTMAINQLESLVDIMENRYRTLQENSVKDIVEYNKINSDNKLPYIVVIIDEFADLMLSAKKQVEENVSRIVAMARAVGIHMVVATQRPSVDVITGVIKANFPSRISCRVASSIDSRTIMGQEGAEKLLGKGDMLIKTAKYDSPTRIQGVFISTGEIEKVVEDVKRNTINPVEETADIVVRTFDDTEPVVKRIASLTDRIMSFISSRHGKVNSPTLQREFKITLEKASEYIEQWKIFQ